MLLALEDREVLVLVMALIALVALIRVRRQLGETGPLMIAAVSALGLALVATNLEEVVTGPAADGANVIEHVAYLAHTVLLLVWLVRVRRRSLAP